MDINDRTDIYKSIAERTDGDIYIGVVGPVRSGKSTFIRRFMDLLVLPNVEDANAKARITDELPQSAAGRTVMTAEPKFIPSEAACIKIGDETELRVRMVDCVGYIIPGALGITENGEERMVSTPWNEEKIPFTEAAETGTRKVIKDHSTIGIVITSDGSTGDLERESYEEAEGRTIKELKELGKPFVVILNTRYPESENSLRLADTMTSAYEVPVIPADCASMDQPALEKILEEALFQFPVSQVDFYLPGFTEGLSDDHHIKQQLISCAIEWAEGIKDISDVRNTAYGLADGEITENAEIEKIDLATGRISISLKLAPGLFYKVVSEAMDTEVKSDPEFFRLLREFAAAKNEYDKLKNAISEAEKTGYGIARPRLSEMMIEEPEVFRQGNKYGVRLKVKAPSMHMIKTDVTTEISPVVGTKEQSEDLVRSLAGEFEKDPDKIWETNIFGRSLYQIADEQMENKLSGVPDAVREKVRRSLQKISDEGKDYFICIII